MTWPRLFKDDISPLGWDLLRSTCLQNLKFLSLSTTNIWKGIQNVDNMRWFGVVSVTHGHWKLRRSIKHKLYRFILAFYSNYDAAAQDNMISRRADAAGHKNLPRRRRRATYQMCSRVDSSVSNSTLRFVTQLAGGLDNVAPKTPL